MEWNGIVVLRLSPSLLGGGIEVYFYSSIPIPKQLRRGKDDIKYDTLLPILKNDSERLMHYNLKLTLPH